jgi:hypothetical protein
VAVKFQPFGYQHSVSLVQLYTLTHFVYVRVFFFCGTGVYSGTAPWGTPPALYIFSCGYLQDRVLWTICKLTFNQNTKCKCAKHPNLKNRGFQIGLKGKTLLYSTYTKITLNVKTQLDKKEWDEKYILLTQMQRKLEYCLSILISHTADIRAKNVARIYMHHNDNRIIQSSTVMVFMKLITELQNILRKKWCNCNKKWRSMVVEI